MDWGFVALILLVVFVVQLAVFVGRWAVRSDWRSTPAGRAFVPFLAMLAVALFGVGLLAFVSIPGWIFAVVFLALNIAMARLQRVLFRAQHQPTVKE